MARGSGASAVGMVWRLRAACAEEPKGNIGAATIAGGALTGMATGADAELRPACAACKILTGSVCIILTGAICAEL